MLLGLLEALEMKVDRLLAGTAALVLSLAWSADALGQRGSRGRILASGVIVDEHGRDEWEAVSTEPSATERARLGSDISDAEYASIDAAIEEYERTYGRLPARRADVPNRYPIYPLAGLYEGDVFFTGFVDLDPAVDDILDWSCSVYTYDGHRGVDSSPRSFGYTDIGVPIYAAHDGRVIETNDGEPDRNTDSQSVPANRVVIDHGGGQSAIYTHMKKKSVAVKAGDLVAAGQQIGSAGSSGHSSGPHLHFETRVDGESLEAFAGKCRPGKSGFTKQIRFRRRTAIIDGGITHVDITSLPDKQDRPEQLPGGGQFQTDAIFMYHWIMIANLPADSVWRLMFRRPDKKVARDVGASYGNESLNRRRLTRFRSVADGMREITGTWTVEYFINGKKLATLPFEVVKNLDLSLNRPPEPLKKIKFQRPPKAGAVPFCAIKHPLTAQDPVYDVLSYEYVWKVNGEVVRRATSAMHSDALAVDQFQKGDTLECTVTPTDGDLEAPNKPVSAKVK